jgi:ubiquinone/menaquinone biosynthesis C-methylase UbiE
MKQEPDGISLNLLAGFYDYLTFAEKSKFRKNQIKLIDIRKGEKVLEVGCGTGALSSLAKIAVGESGEVDAIDIAPKMIATAQQKARKSNLKINFRIASVNELPYPDNSFDLVISSLMFHHLPVKVKKEGLEEIHRVLKKEGRLFLCDFGSPHILTLPLMYLILIWISSTRYQLFGRLPKLINECKFNHVEVRKKGLFLEYYLITKN